MDDTDIRDGDLMAYLDGTATPHVIQRIEQSEVYRQRAQLLAQEEASFIGKLYRHSCPDSLMLSEFSLGYLSPTQASQIKQHLLKCPYCSRELVIHDLFQDLPAQQTGWLHQIKVAVATLIEASSATQWQPAFTMRGENEDGPTLFEANGVIVAINTLDDIEHPGYKLLTGFILGPNMDSVEVHVWLAGNFVTTTAVDSSGNFFIANLVSGTYELIIKSTELFIQIQSYSI